MENFGFLKAMRFMTSRKKDAKASTVPLFPLKKYPHTTILMQRTVVNELTIGGGGAMPMMISLLVTML